MRRWLSRCDWQVGTLCSIGPVLSVENARYGAVLIVYLRHYIQFASHPCQHCYPPAYGLVMSVRRSSGSWPLWYWWSAWIWRDCHQPAARLHPLFPWITLNLSLTIASQVRVQTLSASVYFCVYTQVFRCCEWGRYLVLGDGIVLIAFKILMFLYVFVAGLTDRQREDH